MSVKNNMDLEEEIAMLKKENENLKFKNHKLEFQLSNPTFDDDSANEIIGDRNEEINKLKKENEELKDGENTAEMIDKLNDEFSELQDKNMKLEEQLEKGTHHCAFLSIRVQSLDEENKKLNKEIDEMFEATDYGDDIIQDGYTKLDAIYEWATSACDGFQEENEKLEEEIKELKKEIERLEKLREAVRKELDVEPDPTQETIIKKLKEAVHN